MWRFSLGVRPRNPNSHVRTFATAGGPKLFDKVLIANRGEISCRIQRTCHKLGIKTVAVYSEADANSVFVRMANEAVCIGPPVSKLSYLNIDNILGAVQKTGAQAVHPGYGFLSENESFAAALEKINVKFIGPSSKAMASVADKISAKTKAREAKVSTVPGFAAPVKDAAEAIKIANQVGYPVMVKAVHGGGGKGMRVARNDQETAEGFRLSTDEAATSFGSSKVFVEKYVEKPRHIEIQVLADRFGNAVYLNERECSIQRRNQKVVEEAPSMFLDPDTRRKMGEQAVALAKHVGYESAGTCEFLVDKDKNFYFLEMNTRLQVEHPVTELTTGVDLVEQMIRVAAGHPLPFTQKDIGIKGWSVETRLCAEDPLRDFVPSIGRLVRYEEPTGEGIRVDTGVEEGSEISMYYDPMIAKLITYGKDRTEAIQRLRTALDSYVVRGVTHNAAFLRSVMDNAKFINGDLSTAFIPEEYPGGYKGHVLTDVDRQVLVASALVVHSRLVKQAASLSDQVTAFDPETYHAQQMKQLVVSLGENDRFAVAVDALSASRESQSINLRLTREADEEDDQKSKGWTADVEVHSNYNHGDRVFTTTVNGEEHTLQVITAPDSLERLVLQYKGTMFPLNVRTPLQQRYFGHMLAKEAVDSSRTIVSPMAGLVFSVGVKVGDQVSPGQVVCVVEAMKMQNALRSQKSAIVKAIHVKAGQTVGLEEPLLELEPIESEHDRLQREAKEKAAALKKSKRKAAASAAK